MGHRHRECSCLFHCWIERAENLALWRANPQIRLQDTARQQAPAWDGEDCGLSLREPIWEEPVAAVLVRPRVRTQLGWYARSWVCTPPSQISSPHPNCSSFPLQAPEAQGTGQPTAGPRRAGNSARVLGETSQGQRWELLPSSSFFFTSEDPHGYQAVPPAMWPVLT